MKATLGAYMNRNEIESDPHSMIEGMIIGAYVMGATEGIVYVRAEYPLAVHRLCDGGWQRSALCGRLRKRHDQTGGARRSAIPLDSDPTAEPVRLSGCDYHIIGDSRCDRAAVVPVVPWRDGHSGRDELDVNDNVGHVGRRRHVHGDGDERYELGDERGCDAYGVGGVPPGDQRATGVADGLNGGRGHVLGYGHGAFEPFLPVVL